MRQKLASTSQHTTSQSIRQLDVPVTTSQPGIYGLDSESDLVPDKSPAVRDQTSPTNATRLASNFNFVCDSRIVHPPKYPENYSGSNGYVPPSSKTLDGVELGSKTVEDLFSM